MARLYFTLIAVLIVSFSIAQTKAIFIADNTSGCLPLKVSFINNSTGEKLSNFWQFGDDKISNKPNPEHIFYTAGKYEVTLEVQDVFNKISTQSMVIEVYEQPTASFSYEPSFGYAPAEIKFLNKSDCENCKTSVVWTFGVEGKASINNNPNFTYQDTGLYSVMLKLTTVHNCTDSVSKQVIILPDWSGLRVSVNSNDNKINVFCKLPKLSPEGVFTIQDEKGKVVATQKLSVETHNIEIDTKDYPAGSYEAVLENKSGLKEVKKFSLP